MKEIRVAILGNVDSAKSTLVSTMTYKILDNGRGSAREKVFKHKHEKETGRTSSISFRYVKINEEKYITFIDLAGHEKYFKTTIQGLNGGLADYAILVIGANMGVLKMTKEHLGIIKALNVPFFVVITKLDICPPNVLERTEREITRIIKSSFKKDLVLLDESGENRYNPENKEVINYFKLSNVTGSGLDYFRKHLFTLNSLIDWDNRKDKDTIVWIDNSYHVNGIGIVISGTVKHGEVRINDKLLLGPINNSKKGNNFYEVLVKSIHNNFREDISLLKAGCSGCFNIKPISKKETITKKTIKNGMVMIHKNIITNKENRPVMEFKANITVLHHPTTIRENYEPVIHCGKIAQSAVIKEMNRDKIRTGDKATIKFRFKYRPEFIEKEDILVFREGRTKGIGRIIELL
jgi:small GTP-binding protein